MASFREQVPLAGHTTLRVGGPAARFAEARTAGELIEAARDADAEKAPLLVLGGGSNLLVCDDGFPGHVVKVATSGVRVAEAGDGAVRVTVAAGESWAGLVEWAVADKLAGLECLAGIPGLAGATPIQNVGAYGQEIAAVTESVLAFDRHLGQVTALPAARCGFGYRTSAFKRDPAGRHVVLEVTLRLARSAMSVPVRYAELAASLGVAMGERAPLSDVRDAVLELRRGKGMVLDPADPDTVSAGSFFTNPLLGPGQLARVEAAAGAPAPAFPVGDGMVKVPAAWLIERAGFGRGYPGAGPARISSKHTLALTNRGGATAADLVALARIIARGVREAFGVELAPEPVLVGLSL